MCMHGPLKNSNSVAASLHAKQKNFCWKLTISMDMYKEVYLKPLADVSYRHSLRSVVAWQGRCYFDHLTLQSHVSVKEPNLCKTWARACTRYTILLCWPLHCLNMLFSEVMETWCWYLFDSELLKPLCYKARIEIPYPKIRLDSSLNVEGKLD